MSSGRIMRMTSYPASFRLQLAFGKQELRERSSCFFVSDFYLETQLDLLREYSSVHIDGASG